MKFSCKTFNLKEAISKVERIVSKQTTLPVLANILIKTEKGRLVIGSTNLEIAIRSHVGAKIEEEGEITVPARILSGFLGSIKDDSIECQLIGTELIVKSKNHQIKIKGMEAGEFPIIPEMPKDFFLKLPAEKMQSIIPGVLTSVAHNDTRQELNGVLVRFLEKKIVFASTDSFRLTEAEIKLQDDFIKEDYEKFRENTPSIIVPSLAFSEIQRIAGGDSIEFVVSQNQLFIKSNEVDLISRLVNGNYPEYKQVLPEKYKISAEINKEELVDALKIASLVSSGGSGEVRISNTKNNNAIRVSSEAADSGENTSSVQAKIEGPEFEVVFNCRYFLEGLGVVESDSENVLLKLNPDKSPVMIKDVSKQEKKEKELVYVIMPIIKS